MNVIKKIKTTKELSIMQQEVVDMMNELRSIYKEVAKSKGVLAYTMMESMLETLGWKIEKSGFDMWFGKKGDKIRWTIHRIIEL